MRLQAVKDCDRMAFLGRGTRRASRPPDVGGDPLEALLFPVLVLGIAAAEREDGVGKRVPPPVERMDAHEDNAVVAPLDVPQVVFHGLFICFRSAQTPQPPTPAPDRKSRLEVQSAGGGRIVPWLRICCQANYSTRAIPAQQPLAPPRPAGPASPSADSIAKRRSLVESPPAAENPPRPPSLATTRWQGTIKGMRTERGWVWWVEDES